MNTNSLQRTAFLLSFAACAALTSSLSARAQTTNTGIDAGITSGNEFSVTRSTLPTTTTTDSFSNLPASQTQLAQVGSTNTTAELSVEEDSSLASELSEPSTTTSKREAKNQPVPGTSETSASALLNRPAASGNRANSRSGQGQEVAQELELGRRTRSGSSYVGVGGSIGLTGDSGLGDSGFTVFSKIGITNSFSLRPAVVISGDTDFIIPVTYDFAFQAEPFERINFAPYVGAGVIISTESDQNIGLALTGGVDLPISERFTATGSVTAGFLDDVNLGITIGVGYNFGAGFRF
ncbi:MAG TPA: hypothetical protein V6D28_16795 [Leptolyngbyaceae cyanobacterium]